MTDLDLAYVDPRLVALYDLENLRGADTDFFLGLAAELDAQLILDLGCGTGLLTIELATGGRRVTGVDPSSAMLAVARAKPGTERAEWIEGDSSALGTPAADLVVMTGNVAQVFLEDPEWNVTLERIHAALRPSGHLAFESRNPDARAWKTWNRDATYERLDSPNGPMECWLEVERVADDRVRFNGYNVFVDTGEVVVALSELRFRSLAELTDPLRNAGFAIEHVYGDWHREPVTAASPLFVVVARAEAS